MRYIEYIQSQNSALLSFDARLVFIHTIPRVLSPFEN